MTDVFISYSVKDEKKAKEVHALLTSYGIKAFLAGISLTPGSDWSSEIIANLNKSQWVLFLASKSACESAAVQQELGMALGTNKEIIPVIWEIKPEQLPAWIKSKQAINLAKGDIKALEPTIQRIAAAIKSNEFIGGLIVGALLTALVVAAVKK